MQKSVEREERGDQGGEDRLRREVDLHAGPVQNVQAIDKAKRKPAPTCQTQTREDKAASNTSADRTIEGKVYAFRAKGGEDLLTAHAPRE